MLLVKIDQWASRHNAIGIDLCLTHVIVSLNVIEAAGFFNGWMLVQIFEIIPEIGIIHNSTEIAFEVTVINRIESQ